MHKYMINIMAEIPYPWSRTYFEQATNEGTAISRALRRYRKDAKERNGRTKQIKGATVRFWRQSESAVKDKEGSNGD